MMIIIMAADRVVRQFQCLLSFLFLTLPQRLDTTIGEEGSGRDGDAIDRAAGGHDEVSVGSLTSSC